jgi:hypothetical protein
LPTCLWGQPRHFYAAFEQFRHRIRSPPSWICWEKS